MNKSIYILLILILSGCYVTSYTPDPIYEDNYHSSEVYWINDYEIGGDPYWGYWSGFYYYYGVPHYYPWWYYYQFIPPYHYHVHSHIHIQCDNGNYVYGHRGKVINNKIEKKFIPTIKSKNNSDKSFVFPKNWKRDSGIKYNINKLNYNRTFGKQYRSNSINKQNNNRNKINTTRRKK